MYFFGALILLYQLVVLEGKCNVPTMEPTFIPTAPTTSPTTASPSISRQPSARPTTRTPTVSPSAIPSAQPTTAPPSASPTFGPTYEPGAPTPDPSLAPTPRPSAIPTQTPTVTPTFSPSRVPTRPPTCRPTAVPTYSLAPTFVPTAIPSRTPSAEPSRVPSESPTFTPTVGMTTPTFDPTAPPSAPPTFTVTASPSYIPTFIPSAVPTVSPKPSTLPTSTPSAIPSSKPTATPTFTYKPTADPTIAPTPDPTAIPSFIPTAVPSTRFPTSSLESLASIDLEVTLRNVDLELLQANADAQTAFEAAVAENVPFMEASQVTFLSAQLFAAAGRRLRSISTLSKQQPRSMALSDAVVQFNLLFYLESLGFTTAVEAKDAISAALQSAATSGSFIQSLQTFAAQYGVSAVFAGTSAEDIRVVSFGIQSPAADKNNGALYSSWPLYGKVLLPLCVILLLAICIVVCVIQYQQLHILELDSVEPKLATTSFLGGIFGPKKGGEIVTESSAAGIEAQFADLMLSDEYQGQSAVAALQKEEVSITENPVKSPPPVYPPGVGTASSPEKQATKKTKSSRSILKNYKNTSNNADTPGAVERDAETNITPAALATSPIVPKKQDVIASMFRRPANSSATPVKRTTKDKKDASKKQSKQAAKAETETETVSTNTTNTATVPSQSVVNNSGSEPNNSAASTAEIEITAANGEATAAGASQQSEAVNGGMPPADIGTTDEISVEVDPNVAAVAVEAEKEPPKRGMFSFF